MKDAEILPDLIRPGLKVVICGTGVGEASKKCRHYYADPGNRFWRILADTGLTTRLLKPEEDRLLPSFGIGLTDLAKFVSGTDVELPAGSFDPGRLASMIRAAKPGWLAFNGKIAAAAFLKIPSRKLHYQQYELTTPPGFPPIMVLPQTSGANNAHWDAGPWFELAESIASNREQ